MHSWNIFGAWMNHGHTRIHKIHRSPNLGEATTFPLIIFFVPGHGACTQISFCFRTPKLGVLKFPKLGIPWLWKPITSCADLRLRWGLKQSCKSRWDLFSDMFHATWTQVNQGDSRLFVVRNQIGNLILGLSFGHNLCFKYSNGTCKPILHIYVLRDFQWYNELFNLMSFDPYNRLLKIWDSQIFKGQLQGSNLQLPKWKPTWKCVDSFLHTFLHFWKHEMWLLSFTLNPHLYKPLLWSWAQN
jgi:hypothetical protein